MWWARRPKRLNDLSSRLLDENYLILDKIGAPMVKNIKPNLKAIYSCLFLFAITLPLFGVTLIGIFLLDYVITYIKIKKIN